MNIVKTCAILAFTATVLTACSTTPTASLTSPAASPTAPASATSTAAVTPKSVSGSMNTSTSVPEYLDPKSALSTKRSVYFDFDDYSVRTQYAALLEQHGKYLAANSAVAIKIEGNADERGGAEYNLALGQKRAEAVRRALKVYGVKDTQMEAVSWGKEKPKAKDHDEASRAENRRADLTYPKK